MVSYVEYYHEDTYGLNPMEAVAVYRALHFDGPKFDNFVIIRICILSLNIRLMTYLP